MIPGVTVETDSDSMAPGVVSRAVRVRSGLSLVQWTPPSVVDMTNCHAASSSCWPNESFHTMGCDEVVRALTAGSCAGLTLIHVSDGYEIFTMPLPLAYRVLGSFESG